MCGPMRDCVQMCMRAQVLNSVITVGNLIEAEFGEPGIQHAADRRCCSEHSLTDGDSR